MNIESRIRRAFKEADDYPPSVDLFARVVRSIEQDRTYRRRRRSIVAVGIVLLAGLAGLVAATGTIADRVLRAPRWAMEVVGWILSAALVVALGPAIRRFGRFLVSDLMGGDEAASRRFLDLLDVAYYLVFAGVILVGSRFTGLGTAEPIGELLDEARVRIATLLLTMGLLHSVTVAALPLVALLRNATRWRVEHDRAGTAGAAPEAVLADRLVRSTLVAVGIVFLVGMAAVVVAIVVGILS